MSCTEYKRARTQKVTSPDTYTSSFEHHSNGLVQIYDVKFYPYTDPEVEPVFAIVAGRDVFICRPNDDCDRPFSILNHIQDPSETASLNSIVWSQDVLTGDPLVCVAGANTKSIKIYNAITGDLIRVISGHGGDINDLAVSPRSSEILASCSADYQIRLWALDVQHRKQPCAAIMSGEGHTQPILTLAFHPSGKYLLSGGQDTMVCLWSVPDIPNSRTGSDSPLEIHLPLFASTEVHSDYVDCIQFWGDLILSRAAGASTNKKKSESFKRNDIILWKIDGFSAADNDLTPPVPVHGVHTRSAFGGRFQRLLTFELMPAAPFYMRFSLFSRPDRHPILAMGNEVSKYSFWDLRRLQDGHVPAEERGTWSRVNRKKRSRTGAGESVFGSFASTKLGREGSTTSNASSARASHMSDSSTAHADLKFDVADPYKPLLAHRSIEIPGRLSFACRQVAWSNCGKWCVAVGDYGMTVVFKR
ncbi:WD40-repeat-containing domain protein [Delphinella strobiligena]|nr:WD40-repeat-containing domain protein [Delphinella strobiligena]